MTKHHFSFKEVFMFGWEKTQQHAWFITLTIIIIGIILNAVSQTYFLGLVVSMMIALSLVSLSLQIVRNHSFTFTDLVNPVLSHKRVLKFFALIAFYLLPALMLTFASAIVIAGAAYGNQSVTSFGALLTFILTVASFYVAVRFMFFPQTLVENDHMSVSDIILKSYKLTENNFWRLFCYLLLVLLLNMIGLVFYVIMPSDFSMFIICAAFLVTAPVTLFATTYLYERFKNHSLS